MAQPGSVASTNRNYSLTDLIDCIREDRELLESYQAETRRAVTQQLSTFQRNPLFESAGTSLTELLTPGRMNVLVLSHLSGPLRLVILSAVIRRLMEERMTTSEAEKHLAIRTDFAADERARLESFVASSVPKTLVAWTRPRTYSPRNEARVQAKR
ncbi:MAG: hypothetical protein IPK16_12890 [Anaerolineales bacterium]|nr:hypothetical protein [Anaerolineales bacterium]